MIETYATARTKKDVHGLLACLGPLRARLAKEPQTDELGSDSRPRARFVISTATYYLFSGDKSIIEKLYPIFCDSTVSLGTSGPDGLLPVSDWIRNSVWIDHRGFRADRDKQASFQHLLHRFLLEASHAWPAGSATTPGFKRPAACRRMKDIVRKHFWNP